MIQKSLLFFSSSDFESVIAQNLTRKSLSFDFYPKAIFTLSVSFGFHGPPLLTFKTDRSDLRGLDLGKMTSSTR